MNLKNLDSDSVTSVAKNMLKLKKSNSASVFFVAKAFGDIKSCHRKHRNTEKTVYVFSFQTMLKFKITEQ